MAGSLLSLPLARVLPQQNGVGVQVPVAGQPQGPLEGHDEFVVLSQIAHCKVR